MNIQTKTLKVVGEQTMHCGGCENTVKFSLKQLPGIQEVEASHQTQLIELSFDSQSVNLDQVRQELDWIGYQVVETGEN